ncbi:MAG: penicillin-binding protein activator LpoB [Fibrobacter sp.]|nr:penicillin-binding protein activator LpoB [Fibrobacter sp.]
MSILKTLAITLTIASVALLSSCAKVERIDADSTTDLSGKWNDTDSRLVADEMINDCMNRPWLNKMSGELGRNPTVIVGSVRNKSHEHISVETFTKDMERALINSGVVDFVANASQRSELRAEVEQQQGNATEETRKETNMETGADLMLTGSINTIVDQEDGKQVIFYQVDLELIDLQSQKKVWIGDKKIKKLLTRKNVKF